MFLLRKCSRFKFDIHSELREIYCYFQKTICNVSIINIFIIVTAFVSIHNDSLVGDPSLCADHLL